MNRLFILFISLSTFCFSQQKIKTIEYRTEGYLSSPDFEIIIFCDRTAIFRAKKDNYRNEPVGDIVGYGENDQGMNRRDSEIKGIFKTKLNKKTYNRAIDLINNLDLDFKHKSFSSNLIDNSKAELIVTLSNKKMIVITDIGMDGSARLRKLYSFFKNLRFTAKWE